MSRRLKKFFARLLRSEGETVQPEETLDDDAGRLGEGSRLCRRGKEGEDFPRSRVTRQFMKYPYSSREH